jgi:hypothetical protein
MPLIVNARACAGFWPAAPGWHVLQTDAGIWQFYVRAANDGASLRAALDAQATAAMASPAGLVTATGVTAPVVQMPMVRWPWFLGWLGLSAVVWWLERRSGVVSL